MVSLLLSKLNLKNNGGGGDNGGADYNNSGEQWLLLLNRLESILGSLITASGGGRSEARLWLCNSIAGIKSMSRRQQRDLFVKLLRNNAKDKSLASQLLQMMFERRRQKIGDIIAKRSYLLEKFFDGNQVRIMQWFSNFAGIGGLDHKKGAKALSQFAFVNRDICWEELEWKGKHGQSPAVVATKPHYFLDLDVQRTVENFIENVPEFWSSNEFAESLRDGGILSIDTKYFLDYFVQLMYEEDAVDLWDVIDEFLMEESFSLLCKHLLITLEESDLCIFLDLLRRCLSLQNESVDFGNSSCWLEFMLLKYNVCESIDQLLKLNAIINRGRQLLRLLHDEESHELKTKIKDVISQIHTISISANGLLPLLRESFKLKYIEAVKYLGLQSWVVLFSLSEESRSLDSWESLFLNNGISFRRSDKYALVNHGYSEENISEIDDDTSMKRKRRKKRKSRKRRKNVDDDDLYENKLVDLDTSAYQLGLQSRVGSWLLSTDGFSDSWTDGDLPEHLSKFCFSTWMKWLPTGVA